MRLQYCEVCRRLKCFCDSNLCKVTME
uniref:Uncharacterized protein n=1 Tax=Rhizophora mucronata TaxID=61149 RepID=A0A2P2IJK3_RHIMU